MKESYMPLFTHPNEYSVSKRDRTAELEFAEKKEAERKIPSVRLRLWQWRRCIGCCVIVYASVFDNLLLGLYFRVFIVLHNNFEYFASLLFRIINTFQCHRNNPTGNIFVPSLQLTFDWNI